MQKRDEGGFAADYIPVNERIEAFYAKYPDGSLQADLIELSDTRVVMRASAYRTPDDIRPGVGFSSLDIPGRTPYTRGSEIENCETSAWGRAIAALGFEVKRGIASAEEVRNKSAQPHPSELPGGPKDMRPVAAAWAPKAEAEKAQKPAPAAPKPAAPTVPPEPDWMADDKVGWKERTDWGQPAPAAPAPVHPVANPAKPMSTRDLLDAAQASGIDTKALGAIARNLFGDGLLKNLTDDQRAAVWEEATAR